MDRRGFLGRLAAVPVALAVGVGIRRVPPMYGDAIIKPLVKYPWPKAKNAYYPKASDSIELMKDIDRKDKELLNEIQKHMLALGRAAAKKLDQEILTWV